MNKKTKTFKTILSITAMGILCSATTKVNAQTLPSMSLTGISVSKVGLKLPKATTTSVSLSTSADTGLVETTTTLDRQRITVPTTSTETQVIDIYAGTTTKSVTLYSPTTFTETSANTSIIGSGPADEFPYICSATAPGQAPNVSGTYTDPNIGVNMATGPGEAPKNARGENQATAPVGEEPNPLMASVLSAGTQFARQPYLNSGSFGNGLPHTAPLQISPFPAGVAYPDCGG